MKLHLPKILRVAVLATFALPAMGAALSSSDIATPVAGGDSYLNVGMENSTDTWSGDMVVGDTAETQGDVDKVGAFDDSWGFITPNGGKTNTSITSGLKISGSLTLQGSGKIVLGGQYKGGSSYTGLEAAEAINVTGGSLTATKIITKNLTVSGGSVSTSTANCTSGNGYAAGPKQSYIKESLTISGGSLAFGYTANVQGIGGGGHRMTSLGSSSSFTMTQTGGTMRVYGDLDMKSGITINQSAGTMVLRDTIYMGGSGTTTIDQSGDTSRLVLGRLESTGFLAGVCEFDINQSGGGLIHLAYGSNFAKDSTVNLKQTGTGTINVGGKHDTSITGALPSRGYELDNAPFESIRTTYTIDQGSGSTINIKGVALVKLTTATIGGTVNVASGATLGVIFDDIESLSKEYITVGAAGSWNMEAGSVFGITFSQKAIDALIKSDDNPDTPERDFAFNIEVASGADAAKLLNSEFKLLDMDERLWTLESGTMWVQDGTKTYLSGAVVYNPWIKVTGDTSETFSDESSYLASGLEITDATVKISGNNTHSYGTKIKNSTVTLGHANALGSGQVTTEGSSTLKGASDSKTYNLPTTIQNSGALVLAGSFNVSSLEDAPLPDIYVDVYDEVGDNGFKHYDRFTVNVVDNGTTGTLTLDDATFAIKFGTLTGEMDEITGVATFTGGVDYATYLMVDEDHSACVSDIQTASGDQTTTVELQAGTLIADGEMNVESSGGTLETIDGGMVSGELNDTLVKAKGGEIAADIKGDSSVEVTGKTQLSGSGSDYTGGTVIDNAELVVGHQDALGTGTVVLQNQGILDMGGYAVSNDLLVTGCTIKGASAYKGNMTIQNPTVLDGATSARSVKLEGAGALTGGGSLTTSSLEVATTGDASIEGGLTINNNGTITLNDGKVLSVGNSVTLAGVTTVVLNGEYGLGDELITATSGTLTIGKVKLVFDDPTVELAKQGNSLVLVSVFKQDKADSMVQANWGIATASRAFVNAIRGQRSNTGCIADGRGTAWAAVLGAYNNLDGGDVSLKGAAVGADMKLNNHSTLGMAIGYLDGEVSPTGLSKVDQEGTYIALYGEHGLKKLSSTSCLSIDWVAAYGQTESKYAGMSWEQDSLQLNSRLSWNKLLSERVSLRVFGGLEYFTSGSDTVNGIDTGSIENLRGELGVGLDYVAWGIPADEKSSSPGCKRLVLTGELRYFNDLLRDNPEVRMKGLRGEGENPGRYGVGIDLGATYRINDRWSTSANYGFSMMEGSAEHRVNVGAAYTF